MKKYLIVGASGFIGGNILSILPSRIDITIITSNKKKILENFKSLCDQDLKNLKWKIIMDNGKQQKVMNIPHPNLISGAWNQI